MLFSPLNKIYGHFVKSLKETNWRHKYYSITLKELQMVILCNILFLVNLIISIFAGALVQKAIKPFILAVTQKACIFEKRNDYFCDDNVQ